MKFFQLALLALIPLFASQAHADLQNVSGPVQVACQGSGGWLQVSNENNVLKYDAFVSGHSVQGVIAPFENGQYYSPGGEATTCTQCASANGRSDANWISLGGSTAKKVWVPAHSGCLATRVPNQCTPVQVPGQFEHSWVSYFDLMLMQSSPGQYTFYSLDFNLPEGKATLNSLGAGTVCQVK